MDIETFLKRTADQVESALAGILESWTDAPEVLVDATGYSLFAGGKRLRPALVLEAARVVGGEKAVADAIPAACALEMIHTYSLIHDDLPSMDNDDLRRGKPTLHKAYDEATAILVGDALLTMAFDVAATTNNVDIVREIAQAAGASGMVGGQLIDLASEGKKLSLNELKHLHRSKTGALIVASLRCGAILSGADESQLASLTEYGRQIGLAFQIADDILDVTGDESKIGKPIGSDEGNAKSTYPSILGLKEAQIMSIEVAHDAMDILDVFGREADTLRHLALYIVERNR